MKNTSKYFRVAVAIFFGLLTGLQARSQGGMTSIGGPTCVQTGVFYNYAIQAVYSGSANFSYSISNGTLSTGGSSGTHTGPGLANVQIKWNGNGSIMLTSPAGNKTLSVSISSALSGGTYASGQIQNVAINTVPALLNANAATGGSCGTPVYTYQWQSSTDSVNWPTPTDGSITNTQTYQPKAVSQKTYYRRFVTETTTGNTGYSAVAVVTVFVPLSPGFISPSSQTISYNTNANISVAGVSGGGGAGTYTYQYQSSPDNATWSNVGSPTTSSTFTATNVQTTTWYRAGVTSAGQSGNSASGVVNVAISATLIDSLVSPSGNGSINTLSCTAHGGNGTYTFTWYSSIDGGATFQQITGVSGPTYTATVMQFTEFYVVVSSGGSSANSNTISITMPSAPTITANTITPCNGAATTLTATGGSGTYTWYNSSNTQVGTGTTYSTTAADTYYALSSDNFGVSQHSNTITISPQNSPATTPIGGNTYCVIGSSDQLTDAIGGGTWSSSNTSVLTTDANGVITGISTGTANVTYNVTNACGTSSQLLGITVVPFATYASGLGRGLADPIITDTITLSQGTVKTTQYQQDTASSAHTIMNAIALRVVEETSSYIPGDFSATAVVKIEYGHSPGNISQVDSTSLNVTFTKNGGNKYNAINYFTFNNAEFTRVTVLRVVAPTTVGGVSFDTHQVLQLTNSLMATRYYTLRDHKAPALSYVTPSGGAVPDQLTVNWVYPPLTDNNYTQLEWAWLPNGMGAGYLNGSVFDTTLLFKRNSTRTDLSGGATAGGYNIPLLYGDTGVLFIRARAINMMPNGSRSDGPWSAVLPFSFNGHNASLNWQVTTKFAEEGKRKTVIKYYDGSLRMRQTVTKDNSTNTTISAETFYDGQGRPAVQILPAPGMNNIIQYTRDLNHFNTQSDNVNPLQYFDLATPALGNYATTPLDTGAAAARYYSNHNPELNTSSYTKNIPSTNGYAYAVTRYTPDGTGRVMVQGGIGDSMQLGSNHVSKYYYGTAGQEELDGLFGTEVGDYTHYFKNMVLDANGQVSVSYVDMTGKTIATALAGQSPANLQALPINDTSQYKNQAGSILTRNLLDKGSNVLKGTSIESINTILVPYNTLYNFTYTLPRQLLTLPTCSGTVSYPCKFDLQISIADESGDTPPHVYTYPGIDTISFQQSLVLPLGSYSVRKTLTINPDSLAAFMAQYNTVGVGLCDSLQHLTDSIAASDSLTSGCAVPVVPLSCTSCQAAVGDYPTYQLHYALSIGLTSASQLTLTQVSDVRSQYVNDSTFCLSLNMNVSSSLDNIRKMMLADFVPYSGQYALNTGSGSMYSKFNIFSLTGSVNFPDSQPFYRYPRNLAKTLDSYYDAFGEVDTTATFAKLAGLSADDFEGSFKSSWTGSLLIYHPEYSKLLFAQTNLRPSFNFIDSLNQLVTITGSPIGVDPFFTSVSTSDAPTIRRYSDTTWQEGYSMWRLSYGDAFGCKTIADTTARKNCFAGMPSQFATTGTLVNPGTGNVTLTGTMQAQAWSVYKSFYSQARQEMVYRYINAHADSSNNTNLIQQGYRLYFPVSTAQQAQNIPGWSSWYPAADGTLPTVNVQDSAAVYSSHCGSYITAWQNALLQCPALAAKDPTTQTAIISSITGKLLLICQQGTDGANPYGSSTVAPAYAGTRFPSFDSAVSYVMDSAGIGRDQYCNPYGIEFPKPHGFNAVLTRQQVSAVDTCTCSQFARLKTEVTTAGYNATNLTSINQYLWLTYHDTITTILYQGLLQCGQTYLTNCRVDSTVDPTCNGLVNSSGTISAGHASHYASVSPSGVNINAGQSATFTATMFQGCSPYSYQWQKSTDGITFTPISGATSSTYTAVFNTTTYLQVTITDCGGPLTSLAAEAIVGTCYLFSNVHCDTLSAIPLLSPQPLPQFLTCGFTATSGSCFSCSKFQSLDSAFFTLFNTHPVFTGTIANDTVLQYNELFARYVNFKTGLQYSWQYYAQQFSTTGCPIGGFVGTGAGLSICLSTTPLTDTTGMLPPAVPCQQIDERAGIKAAAVYDQLQQQLLATFQSTYLAQCLAARETFTMTDTVKEYHYTLYYYDQAGNLEKTVPPKGVNPNFTASFVAQVEQDKPLGISLVPGHTLATRYCYNTLNQVNIQSSPDGGVSKFWYDRLGRVTLSQNGNQERQGNVYSYTLYDSLGRITEVGQITGGSAISDAVAKNDASLQAWISAATASRNQITQTVFDTAYPAINGVVLSQQNLRNRVSYMQVVNNATDAYPAGATYYTYDVHGNVDTLLQDFGNSSGIANAMNQTGNRFKRVQYEYDLVSGKANRVVYQPGYWDVTLNAWVSPPDQYYHLYAYDAENRITDVYTGRDSVMLYLFPEREAHYTYYKHGPLARANMGQLSLQGLDYAYTLQGWLKGVNPAMGGTLTNGTDTTEANPVAEDAYGYSLHYYKGDYQAIGYTPQGTSVLGALGSNAAPLYNGNIAAMAVDIPQLGATKLYNYHYDQLNRLIAMDAFNGLSGSGGTFTPVSISDYQERVAYDPNGNIRTYNRHGDATRPSMDSLTYFYNANSNQLNKVTDAAADAIGYNDIKQGQTDNNYGYDAIGNLTSDVSSNNMSVTWTVYGKIKSITQNGSVVNYTYDATGHRISKSTATDTTIYVRDGSGNVLSVYEKAPAGHLLQTQVPLYGSSRLGIVTQHMAPDTLLGLSGGFVNGKKSIFTRGEKLFELTNHLGNVLVAITDRRQQQSAGGLTVDSYRADVASASDYYPFGMLMPFRNYNAGGYRYGFNGKENDNEVKGVGNQIDFGERVYDPRVSKFLSIDPDFKKAPEYSPYLFAGNKPISRIDFDGRSESKPPIWTLIRELVLYGNDVLNAKGFQDLAKENGVDPGYKPRLGRIFEDAVLRSANLQGQKQNIYPYPVSNPTKYFTPDAVENYALKFTDGSSGTYVDHQYTAHNALITDVKFTTLPEVPLQSYYNPDQIKGYIDYLANVRGVVKDGVPTNDKASDYGLATLVLATNFGVEISQDIINYAKEKNVSVYQRVAFKSGSSIFSDPGKKDDRLKISEAFPVFQARDKMNDPVIEGAHNAPLGPSAGGNSATGSSKDIDWSKQ